MNHRVSHESAPGAASVGTGVAAIGSPARSATRSWLRHAAGVLLSVAFCLPVQGQEAAVDEEPVLDTPAIAAGQEDLISEMIGTGTTLGGGCVVAEASVSYTVITATYACPDGNVVLELGHPDNAGRDAVPTSRFAITLRSGKPPGNLIDSVVSKVRAHEDRFEWTWTESAARRVAPQ